MFEPRPRRTQLITGAVLVCLLGLALGAGAVATNALGAGDLFDRAVAKVDRFIAGPPPDRPTVATVEVEDPLDVPGAEDEDDEVDAVDEVEEGGEVSVDDPATSEAPAVDEPTMPASEVPASDAPSVEPSPSVDPAPTPTAAPVRKKVDVDIVKHPKKVFASQVTKDWCAPAGVQMALAVMGLADTSADTQRKINGKVRKWESYADSHNGDWGPAAMVEALAAYGAPGYEIHAYKSRQGALRGAARAIKATGAPVILLAWRGAHTWVMTGYRADADPSVFKDATVTGAYILDPWYPRVSSIWGASDPPGTFQNASEMERNFLKWRRPEGKYPDRDGKYIVVTPTVRTASLG